MKESPAGSHALSRQPDRAADCQIFARHNCQFYNRRSVLTTVVAPGLRIVSARIAGARWPFFSSVQTSPKSVRATKVVGGYVPDWVIVTRVLLPPTTLRLMWPVLAEPLVLGSARQVRP